MSQPTISPDVAFLRRLTDLEQQMAALQRSGLLANAGVRTTAGPAAQAQNKGVVIYDASGAERVRLGVSDSDASPAAAQSLYGMSAKDANGVVRVILGQTSSTPTYGLSTFDAAGVKRFTAGQIDASHDGAAAYDASGNVIWDSTGLVATMKLLASNSSPSTVAQAYAASFTNVPSSSGSFTLSRPGNVLVLSQTNFFTNGGTANYGLFRINVLNSGSVSVGASQYATHTNGSGVSSASPYVVLTGLAADTYTVWMQYELVGGATTTWQLESGRWDAFQLGA